MKGVKSPFHQKVKTNFKKNFHSGGIFRLLREFTLRWKETKKLLSHLYNGKKVEKRFMENQQLVKYFDFFSFFWDEKSSSGIFTIREGNKKPLPHEMVKRSFNMQKQASKKFFIFFEQICVLPGIYLMVEGGNKPFTSKKGNNSDENIYSKSIHYKKVEKFFIFLGRFRPLRDFYLMQQENNF